VIQHSKKLKQKKIAKEKLQLIEEFRKTLEQIEWKELASEKEIEKKKI